MSLVVITTVAELNNGSEKHNKDQEKKTIMDITNRSKNTTNKTPKLECTVAQNIQKEKNTTNNIKRSLG